MAAPWTLEENMICIKELPLFRKYMIISPEKKLGVKGEEFARFMLETYPNVWKGRNRSSLYQHMEYLDDVTSGRCDTDILKDKQYCGILLEEDELIESFIPRDIKLSTQVLKIPETERKATEHTLGGYRITDYQIEKLQAFVGYGDRKKSKIIFFGNEEGLGMYELENVIEARCKVFGQNPETFFNEYDWRDGYYEIPEESDLLFNEEIERLRGELKPKVEFFSPMIEFQARIVLHLLNPEKDWFLKKADNDENYGIIKRFYQTGLYNIKSNLNVALMDLRPFPRRDERGKWPYQNIDRLQYLKAFDFNSSLKIEEFYENLRNNRARILKRTIEKSNAEFLIGIGAKDIKRRFLEQCFDSLVFEEIQLTNKNKIYKTKINVTDNRQLTILLCDFFDYRYFNLSALEELVKKHIRFE